ncbi:MAG: trypsin-like peptidase domain-containing protein [Planctomycetes bacterium]|nr:trypsin-like peptidase domain-containing protein [Planctomycetota bacterium]
MQKRMSSSALGTLVSAILFGAAIGQVRADVIHLQSGSTIDGQIVKRSDKRVWIDIGADVLSFDMEDVAKIDSAAAAAPLKVEKDDLFHTAVNAPTQSPKEHARTLGPAVVKISTPSGLGSGVIIDKDGHAITNAHVVQGEQKLKATVWFPQSDGTLKRVDIDKVELIAVNNHLDLALVKIPQPKDGEFTFAPVQKEEQLDIGQAVFAIGNPLGLERTLTQGVISTTQRSFDGLTYIQTDCPINPGNSGGPLFNTRGEVIGITNMGIRGGESLGFAIPARYVKDFVRNREAFTYDRSNPNSGHNYHDGPTRSDFGTASELLDASGAAK